MEALTLMPVFQDYLWGGTKLKKVFNKNTPFECTAESWELSTHGAGESIVLNGPSAGCGLLEYFGGKHLPIIVKLIDAEDNLSIQVHPNDEYALKNEKQTGKAEMWYIINADEGAFIYYGFNTDVTKEELAKRIKENTVLEVLNKVPVKDGDAFFIAPGTVHAIGKGILLAEVQQSSNLTYRVYDYDRREDDGRRRPLHVWKALEVINFKKADEIVPPEPGKMVGNCKKTLLANCKYFKTNLLESGKKIPLKAGASSLHSLLILEGAGVLKYGDNEELFFFKGDSLLVPAGLGAYSVTPKGKDVKLVILQTIA